MAVKREKVTRTAEKLVGKGKLEAAIKEYRKILAENPNDANVLNRVGDLYARIERFDEAVKLFSQIAEQYTRDGFFLKAIAIYKKIIKLAPASLQVYERLAELYHRQGLLNEARSQFQILADHYEKRDNATSAITIYQRMAEIDPDNPANYVRLAELFYNQRLHDKARQSYRQLADLLLIAGSVDEATQVYLRALDHYHGELGFVGEVVRSLRDEGHTEAADQVFEKARQLNPEASAARLGLAEPAAEEAEEAVVFEPPPEPPAMAPPPEPTSPEAPDSSAYEIPAESLADAEVDFASFAETEEDDSVFTLDLDSDEPAATQVMPPSDLTADAAGPPAAGSPGGVDSGAAPESSLFDAATEAAAEAAQALSESPVADEDDLDWSIDDFDEIEEAEPEDVVPVELDESAFEFEIEPPVEIELEDDEPETVQAEPAAGPPAAGPPADTPTADASTAPAVGAPEAMARREEDLLAEARVFSKYNLREKAEDRLLELLDLRSDHFEALCLMARLDLEAGRHDEAVDRARAAAEAAAASDDLEPFEQLREDFASAGLELGEDLVVRAAEKAVQKPFAQLLEDLDESSTAVPVDFEAPEGFELEPVEDAAPPPDAAVAGMDTAVDADLELADAGLELADVELEVAAAEPEAATVEPAADLQESAAVVPEKSAEPAPEVGPETTSFTLGPLDLEDEEEAAEEWAESIDQQIPPATQTRPFARVEIDETLAVTADAEPEPAAEIEELMKSAAVEPELDRFEDLDLAEPAAESPPPAAPPDAGGEAAIDASLVSLVDELGLDESGAEIPPADVSTEPVAPSSAEEAYDETGMSWLDDVAAEPASAAAQDESIFDEEDDFFDLAAELEAEIAQDEEDVSIEAPQEQSLQEIIDGFKRGVAENLSTEDYDTHFNLGIAYREMGLLDEAIGEFQLASKDPRYIVECSSMLGICFLDKGLPELAVRWYRKGLESPTVSEDQAVGLLYDMASAYLNMGDNDAAYRTFVEIYGMNSNYRDVAQRIQELSQQQTAS